MGCGDKAEHRRDGPECRFSAHSEGLPEDKGLKTERRDMKEETPIIKKVNLEARIQKLEKEIYEYIKVEQIIVAAGLLDKEKFEQAHEIIRSFK